MQMGDVVVRINEIPTGNMSYYDAHQLLACAGNQFVLGILRLVVDRTRSSESEAKAIAISLSIDPGISYRAREVSSSQRLIKEKTPSGEVEYINTSPKPFWTPNVTSPAPLCQLQTQEEREIDEKIPDAPITDEQIAEILSGEAEVLKQHNIIG